MEAQEQSEVTEAPNWLKELEAKRERRVKARLGHEAGAGALCLTCGEKCPGLDLHFWRKICKNCKCSKENHDVPDEDIYGWAQFQLLGSKPNKIKTKIVLPGKNDEVELDWTPKGHVETVDRYLKTLPVETLPVVGSEAAQARKQLLQKQIPIHDLDPTLCHELSESEAQKMYDYIEHIKHDSVGVGRIIENVQLQQALLTQKLKSMDLVASAGTGDSTGTAANAGTIGNNRTTGNTVVSYPTANKSRVEVPQRGKSDITTLENRVPLMPPNVNTLNRNPEFSTIHDLAFSTYNPDILNANRAMPLEPPTRPHNPLQFTGSPSNSVIGGLPQNNPLISSSHTNPLISPSHVNPLASPSKNALTGSSITTSLPTGYHIDNSLINLQSANLIEDNKNSPVNFQARSAANNAQNKQLSSLSPARGYNVPENQQEPTQVNVGSIRDIYFGDPSMISPPLENVGRFGDYVDPNSYDTQLLAVAPLSHKICRKCSEEIADDFAIFVDRSDSFYHTNCFKCAGCNQSLADMVYFYDKDSDELYCGRDYAKIRGIPRCQACDELIFVKEYCLAENSTYHVKHFCCFECDRALAGQNYVVEDNMQPFCLPCYETLKANQCKSCYRVIKPDEQGCNLNGIHFHATDSCVACKICKTPLLGMKLLLRNERLYCSHSCFSSDQSRPMT